MLRWSSSRLVVEALVIVVSAIAAGAAQIGGLGTAAIVFGVFICIAAFEYSLSRDDTPVQVRRQAPPARRAVAPPPVDLRPAPRPESARIELRVDRSPEPAPVEPRPEPRREPAPVELRPVPTPPAAPPPVPAGRWNIRNLDRIARDGGPGHEELPYLVLYLRDHAAPDGTLPSSFDAVVREAFGELLSA